MSIAARIVVCLSLVCAACGDDPAPPITGVNATATPTPASWIAPVSVAFNCDPVGGTAPFVYAWDFGDGMQASSDQPTHTYTDPRTYTATCEITDANGQVGSLSLDLGVLAPTP
jgi:PKD repeat protein